MIASLLAGLLASLAAPVTTHVVGSPVIAGSGHFAAETRRVHGFGAVDVGDAVVVNVRVGRTERVVVHADDNVVPRVGTYVDDRTLVIRAVGSFSSSERPHVDVDLPAIARLRVAGSADVSIFHAFGERLDVVLSGSGHVVGSGAVTHARIVVDGSGRVDFGEIASDEVEVFNEGHGDVHVNARRSLHAFVLGGGHVQYGGRPKEIMQRVNGTGGVWPT